MWIAAAIAVSYFLGDICFAYVVGKLGWRIDLRQHGSGNLGGTNVLRVLGPVAAILVILGDVAKGFVAVWLGSAVSGHNPVVMFACALAVIAGHNWPILLGFKGGKGIAASLGVLLALTPLAAIPPAIVFVLAVATTRYVSLGSILAAITYPITVISMLRRIAPSYPALYVVGSLAVSAFALYRHIPNMRRLLAGTERKVGQKVSAQKSSGPEPPADQQSKERDSKR